MVRIKGGLLDVMTEPMTIAAFARAAGVGVETVRYYQRRDLLDVPPREHGARRYGDTDLRRLRFIRAAQSAGFPLAEIAELLALNATDDRARAYEITSARLAVLDERIATLEASRDALRHLADRCGKGGDGPCPILEAFDGG